jgi:hypothetical protein
MTSRRATRVRRFGCAAMAPGARPSFGDSVCAVTASECAPGLRRFVARGLRVRARTSAVPLPRQRPPGAHPGSAIRCAWQRPPGVHPDFRDSLPGYAPRGFGDSLRAAMASERTSGLRRFPLSGNGLRPPVTSLRHPTDNSRRRTLRCGQPMPLWTTDGECRCRSVGWKSGAGGLRVNTCPAKR